MINSIFLFFQGKKTYFLVLVGAIVWIAQVTGHISPELANQIYVVLGIGSVGTIHAAITRQ